MITSRTLRRLWIVGVMAAMLFWLPAKSVAGGWNGNGWEGVWLTRQCVGDDLVYYINIGWGNSYTSQAFLTLSGYCKCKNGPSARQANPHQSGGYCLVSTNTNGGQQPGANTQASGAAPGAGGPAGPAPQLRQAVPTALAAFTPAVPFRAFPLPKFFPLSSSPPTPNAMCDASISPTAFAVFHEDDDVVRTNMCSGEVLASIPVASNPLQVQVTPDGAWAIVTSYDNAISFINTATNTVANVIQTDQNTFPAGLSISPDGSFALVTSYIDQNPALLVIDVHKQAITSRIPLDREYPQSVFLNPDATVAWVTYPFEDVVEAIDVMTGVVDYALSVELPIDVVFNPTGTLAYISSESGSVMAVNTATYAAVANVPTAPGSSDLLLSPNGGYLTVNNFDSSSISTIDTSSLTTVNTTPATGQPVGILPVPVQ